MHLRSLIVGEWDALRSLAACGNDQPYDLGAVLEEKCHQPGVSGLPELVLAENGGVLQGLAVRCGPYLRLLVVDRDQRRSGIGQALLSHAEQGARDSGLSRLTIAAEPGNYFVPGIWTSDSETIEFFSRRGYRSGEETTTIIASIPEKVPKLEAVRNARADDRPTILAFVESAFGTPWRLEVERSFAKNTPSVVIAESAGAVAGFGAYEANNRGLGTFGPAGVLPVNRGRGLGGNLLLAALAGLRDLGFERVIIPWISDFGFYERYCNIEHVHTFLPMSKAL